jgi:phosphatidylserine/phosphatidylglycerophosphate/cardiolipin synthase-like enzyme
MPFASTMRDVPPRRRFRLLRRLVLLAFMALWVGVAFWQTNKPLPPGVHVESPWYPVKDRDITFIADITSADAYGRPVISQAIFDEVLGVVRSARKFIVLDYFLFNSLPRGQTEGGPGARRISAELRDALIERRRQQPGLQVLFITDPINEVYGGSRSADLRLLRAAGVDVAVTDLGRLRDSNFVYSSLWRLGMGWWSGDGRTAENPQAGWLPNPFGDDTAPISLGAWARLVNFKANQRKVVIADDGHGGLVGVVGSANPHDASSAHSNTALKVRGPVLLSLLRSELDIARFSGWTGQLSVADSSVTPPAPTPPRSGRAKVLTEGAIRTALLERIDAAARGDNIDIAAFYIAERGIVEALLAAARRGVAVRLILDPNKDTFGHDEGGIPNRPVASELVAASDGAIHVRWYRTHTEQFHAKLAMIYGPQTLWLAVGSADLTRRNLGDYNLEADVALELDRESPLAQQTLNYFDTLWSNRAALGIEYTADFGYYADPSQLLYWTYRVMEGIGLCTF